MITADRIIAASAIVGMAAVTGIVAYVGITADDARLRPSDYPTVTVTMPAPTSTVEHTVITEGDPGWNCLTMGNRVCGPDWQPIPESLYTGLGVSDDEQCVWLVGDTTVIACSDDQVFTS